MVIKVPTALSLQQAPAFFTQMQPVMDPLVVKKSRPQTCQQARGRQEGSRDQIETPAQHSRDGQAIERMNQNLVTMARVLVMIEMKLVNDSPHPEILRVPVEEVTMQEVFQ